MIENITTIQGFDPSATITRSVEKTSTESTLFYKGWRFSATHSTILDSAELEALTGRIAQRVLGLAAVEPCDHIDVDGCLLHLPPMLFGSDALVVSQLEEGNGGDGEEPRNVIFFNACDALCLWAHQHKESEGFASGAVLQVPYANAWAERNGVDTSAASANVSPVKKALKPWDWTFCSDYCFSWSSKQDEAASYFSDKFSMRGCSLLPQPGFALGARELSRRAVQPGGRFERAPTSGVDLSLLSATDQPILFFDETLMYQDDLGAFKTQTYHSIRQSLYLIKCFDRGLRRGGLLCEDPRDAPVLLRAGPHVSARRWRRRSRARH